MARSSTNENKNAFWQARESLGLSREAASELLERIPPERIARIETEKFSPHPDEVLLMSEKIQRSHPLQLLLFSTVFHRSSVCS